MIGVNVLVIIGIRARSINRALAQVGAECSRNGITVTVFDSLGDLPPYRHSWRTRRTPHSVVALRAAANEADAALVVANYHGRVPATVHIMIDSLTRRRTQGALYDKPLTVIGYAAGCYSGVWSPGQIDYARGISGSHVVESITVPTLREAVRKLADDVNSGRELSRPMRASERNRSHSRVS
jgi:NADPH-dependent FMN reductase